MSKIAVAKDRVALDVGNRSRRYIDGTIGLLRNFMGVAIKISYERLLHRYERVQDVNRASCKILRSRNGLLLALHNAAAPPVYSTQ